MVREQAPDPRRRKSLWKAASPPEVGEDHTEVNHMAKETKTKRKPQKTVAVSKFAPLARAGYKAYRGYRDSAGQPTGTKFATAADFGVKALTGFDPAIRYRGDRSQATAYDVGDVGWTVGLSVGGKMAHKGAQTLGVNQQLRAVQSLVGLRKHAVI